MIESFRDQAVIDKFEIIEVSTISRWCRDSGDWARLVECFHPDASVNTSWFNGGPSEFGEEARKMMAKRRPMEGPRHIMGNPHVTLKGDRAVCEYTIILYTQRTIDGYAFDFQTWNTAVDLFEKRNGEWRISKRSQIYEKDRMDPHHPGEVPRSYFAQMDLSEYPAAVRYHLYRQVKSGQKLSKNLVVKGSPEEKAIHEEAAQWLAGR